MGKLIAFVGAPGSKKDYLAAKLYVYAVESGVPATLSLGVRRFENEEQPDFMERQLEVDALAKETQGDDIQILSSCWLNHLPYIEALGELSAEEMLKGVEEVGALLSFNAIVFLGTTQPTPENLKIQKALEDLLLQPAFKGTKIVGLTGLSYEAQQQKLKATLNSVFLGETAL